MSHILKRVPGLLILLGGLYTIFHYHQELERAKERYEESHALLKPLSGIVLAATSSVSVLMILGGVVAFMGLILIVKPFFIVTFFTFFLAIGMMNWVGSILAVIGSAIGFIYFCKNLSENDEQLEKGEEHSGRKISANE